MGCVALALVATLPARGETPIHFDNLAAWEALNSQYLSEGVIFGPGAERWTVVESGSPEWPAPSPPNLAALLYDSDGEIQFTNPVAGATARFVTGGSQVRVTAYSPTGAVLDARTVASQLSASVLYAFTASNTRIARLLIEGTPALWGMDDLTLDRGAPPVTAAGVDGTAGSGGWYRSAATVTLRAGDPNGDAIAAVHYAIDGGAEVTTPGPEASFALSTEGEHEVRFYAVDSTGMVETATVLPLKLDWTPPVLDVHSPTATTYLLGGPITITAAAGDALSGMGATHLDVDGSVVTSGQTLTDLAAGSHLFTMEGRDVAGNATTRTISFEVVVPDPGVPPVTTASLDGTLGENGWYRSAVTVHLSATDPDGDAITAVYYSIDGGADIAAPGSGVAFELAVDGEHTVRYHAVDARGLVEAETVLPVRLDGTVPVLSVASPTASSYPSDAGIAVAAATADASSGVVETRLDIDGTAVTAGQTVSGLAVGPHLFTATARDAAGNEATSQVSFSVVEPTPPPEPTPSPTPISVCGGGTALVNGHRAVVSLWARRNAAGETTGHLVYKELSRDLRVHCRPIRSIERTATGLRIAGEGTERWPGQLVTDCSVGFEVWLQPDQQDAFTLEVDGSEVCSGHLIHGHFVVK
jgi:hypothetical protein